MFTEEAWEAFEKDFHRRYDTDRIKQMVREAVTRRMWQYEAEDAIAARYKIPINEAILVVGTSLKLEVLSLTGGHVVPKRKPADANG